MLESIHRKRTTGKPKDSTYQKIATKYSRRAIFQQMNLRSFSVVLVLTGKTLSIQSLQNFLNGFGRFGQHGCDRNTRCQCARLVQGRKWNAQSSVQQGIVRRDFGIRAFNDLHGSFQSLFNGLLFIEVLKDFGGVVVAVAVAVFGRTVIRRECQGMRQRNQDRGLRQTNAQLPLQSPDNVFHFQWVLTLHQ